MNLAADLANAQQKLQAYLTHELPRFAAAEAEQIINDSFNEERYAGSHLSPKWVPRKKADKRLYRALLVLTGQLKRGNLVQALPARITISNHIEYAKIHNEGGTITQAPRSETFKRPRNTTAKDPKKRGKFSKVNKANPLTPGRGNSYGTRTIDIPQRQYMPIPGEPFPVLEDRLNHKLDTDLPNILSTNN